jgi:elongation factor Ts
MEINSKMVADLRAETGVGMMECKKALVEAAGDFEAARTILRKKGLAAAASKAGRAASEGLVVAKVGVKGAVLVEVNCETDFVARTEGFREFAEKLAERIAAHDAFGDTSSGEVAEAGRLSWPGGETVHDAVVQLVATLKENIQVRRFVRWTPRPGEAFSCYVHGNGRIGVVVGMPGGDEELGKDLAMHVAASDPRFAARGEVTPEILEAEREIARAQATASGKPANVVERIANGKVEKFYQETVLTEQAFVKDPDKTVGQVIVERGGKAALGLRFARFKLGESLGRSAASAGTAA